MDPCKTITNEEFRKLINDKMDCVGIWCKKRNYSCNYGHDENCYHVEHIIDENGADFNNEECNNTDCKNIIANRVMAWGRWNYEIGRYTKMNYYDGVVCEKEIVYGNYYKKAKEKIQQCINLKNSNNVKLGIGITMSTFVFVIIVGVMVLKRKQIKSYYRSFIQV